jgi:hypothetical protein
MSKFSTFQLAGEPRSKANGQPLLASSIASAYTLLIDVREQGTDQGSSVCVVVPCSLSESISTSWYVVMVVLTLHLPVFNASVGFTLHLPASSLHLQRFMWPLPQKTRRQSTIRSARASSSLLYRKTFRRSTMSVGRGA